MLCLEMVFNILIVLQRPHDDFWANPSLSSAFYWPRWTEVTVRSLFGELHKDTICKERCLCLMSFIRHRSTAGQPPLPPAWLLLRSKCKNLTNLGCSQDPWSSISSPGQNHLPSQCNGLHNAAKLFKHFQTFLQEREYLLGWQWNSWYEALLWLSSYLHWMGRSTETSGKQHAKTLS